MRSGLVLVLAILLILALVVMVRALAAPNDGEDPVALPSASAADEPAPSDGGGAEPTEEPTPEAETAQEDDADDELVRSDTVGDGTWASAAPADAPESTDGVVHTYALRVEGGVGIDADEAAAEIAEVLANPRGWQGIEDVTFQRVATPEEAEFTISLASPPTVDQLCLPARTGGMWSCRVGPDVVLNSDRWQYATPTYDDLGEYRAYMINHEVGHFLGHGHADCGGEGEAAPVMLQQSIDLQGCTPNAWPAEEPSR